MQISMKSLNLCSSLVDQRITSSTSLRQCRYSPETMTLEFTYALEAVTLSTATRTADGQPNPPPAKSASS